MTLIKLGSVSLHVGMSLQDAKNADEAINNNMVKQPKKKKKYSGNVELFKKYDNNHDGVISETEYKKYRSDLVKDFEKKMKAAKKEVQKTYDVLSKKGEAAQKNSSQPKTYCY